MLRHGYQAKASVLSADMSRRVEASAVSVGGSTTAAMGRRDHHNAQAPRRSHERPTRLCDRGPRRRRPVAQRHPGSGHLRRSRRVLGPPILQRSTAWILPGHVQGGDIPPEAAGLDAGSGGRDEQDDGRADAEADQESGAQRPVDCRSSTRPRAMVAIIVTPSPTQICHKAGCHDVVQRMSSG